MTSVSNDKKYFTTDLSTNSLSQEHEEHVSRTMLDMYVRPA
jgi:hypothetical protein